MEEELGVQSPAPVSEDSSFLSGKAGPSREPGEELDLSFLPDELSTQEEPGRHDDTGVTSRMMTSFHIKMIYCEAASGINTKLQVF